MNYKHLKEQMATPKEHFTDTSNAEKIAKLYGNKLRFDYKRGRWLIWKGHRWQPDSDGSISQFAIKMTKVRYKEAGELTDSGHKKLASKWAIASESRMRIEAMVSLAKTFKPIADDGKNWDLDTTLLSCTNGIVDLTTGKLRDGKPEDRITMCTGTEYNLTAMCPRWEQFISEVFGGDDEMVKWMQKALGYSISGDMREQVIFFGYGSGSNGKSVLFSTIKVVLGDYAYNVPSQTFTKTYNNNQTNELASLDLKRFVISSEALTTTRLNEQRLKALSGGDVASARFLYKEFFEFQPMCKIWLFFNHRPQIDDDSFAFWRRVRTIPFNQKFTGDKADQNLPAKLKEEKSGILNWLIKGFLLWQEEGLKNTPTKIVGSTDDYRAENDELFDFMVDKCETSEDYMTFARELFKAYVEWADENKIIGKDRLSNTAFGRRMGDKFTKKHTRLGIVYHGLKTKNGQTVMGLGQNLASGEGLDPHLPISTQDKNYIDDIRKTPPNPSPSLKNPSPSLYQTPLTDNKKPLTNEEIETFIKKNINSKEEKQ